MIKILIVCSGNASGFDFKIHQAFIYDQAEAVRKFDNSIEYDTFFVKGKGVFGYAKNLSLLKEKINAFQPNVIHAHGGHIALLCVLQKRVPVVATFHGSDINYTANRLISHLASLRASASVFVSAKLLRQVRVTGKNTSVIPCGVDSNLFYPIAKQKASESLGFPEGFRYILFSSHFSNPVKNYTLADAALKQFPGFEVLEIKVRSREEVNLLINGAELLLLTSFSEGSPQVIKEAMACNCPIVATDVGDIREVIGETEGCYLTTFDPADVAEKIKLALAFGKRTNGREKIMHLDNKIIAGKIVDVYNHVLKNKPLSRKDAKKLSDFAPLR